MNCGCTGQRSISSVQKTLSEDFAIKIWCQSHECFFIYTCACYVLSVLKRSLCIMIYYWGQISCPLYGIWRCPHLGGFLSIIQPFNWDRFECPLFGCVSYWEVSIKGGSTVLLERLYLQQNVDFRTYMYMYEFLFMDYF